MKKVVMIIGFVVSIIIGLVFPIAYGYMPILQEIFSIYEVWSVGIFSLFCMNFCRYQLGVIKCKEQIRQARRESFYNNIEKYGYPIGFIPKTNIIGTLKVISPKKASYKRCTWCGYKNDIKATKCFDCGTMFRDIPTNHYK